MQQRKRSGVPFFYMRNTLEHCETRLLSTILHFNKLLKVCNLLIVIVFNIKMQIVDNQHVPSVGVAWFTLINPAQLKSA